jgi:hypothetical protein
MRSFRSTLARLAKHSDSGEPADYSRANICDHWALT